MNEKIEFEALMTDRHISGFPGPKSVDIGLSITKPFHSGSEKSDGFHPGSTFTVTMTRKPELNPCPRCGGEMVMGTGVHTCVSQCKKCGATGPVHYNRAEAVQAHNARKCPELDPCPHCGEEWRLDRSKKLYSARCGGCDHRTKWHRTIYDLAADVNRRPQ